MSLCLSRAVRRQQQLVLRRPQFRTATTTSEAASVAKDKTSEAASKASEGLSRVTSSAGSSLSKAGTVVGSTLSGIGGRTGRLIGFVQSLIPPTIYYSKVGLELGKIVFREQKMNIPSMQTFQTYLGAVLKHPTSLFTRSTTSSSSTIQPTDILSQIRNMDSKSMAGAGIVMAEVLGFFSVGEMLGRLKIVGYRSSAAHGEH